MEQRLPEESAPESAPVLLGAHFSIAGGLFKAARQAAALGCTALQVFTKNASTWKEKVLQPNDIDAFKTATEKAGIFHAASHTSYLINLASPDRSKRTKSIRALVGEMRRASQLAIPFVVMHPGAHMGRGETEGIGRLSDGINRAFDEIPDTTVVLLLETTAGQGSCLGHRFDQLAGMIRGVYNQERIGVCLDTAHIFAAGYDLRTQSALEKTMAAFEMAIGRHYLRLIHLNDSKKGLGSRIDRHEHIGDGTIGIECFKMFMNDPRFRFVPKIIETPKGNIREDWDMRNLDRLHSLVASNPPA